MGRFFCGLLLACLVGCRAPASQWWQAQPITGNTESLAGARAALAVEARYGGVVRDAEAEGRMQRVGQRLARAIPEAEASYQYRVLDTDWVNAISLPGGYIYVTRGLQTYLSSDELLAAVLAHEMAHLASKDHFKPRLSNPNRVLNRESAADRLAAEYLDAAGLRPAALIDVIQLISDALPDGWDRVRTVRLAASLRDSR